MEGMAKYRLFATLLSLAVLTLLWAGSARAASPQGCVLVEIQGEARAGQEWKTALGQGWVFRLVPIHPAQGPKGEAWSGWDLVVDREQPAGFPDALLLATPPYSSMNEHEVGTTYGLRAQDAVGWNPRSFHFLTSPEALLEARQLFFSLHAGAGKSAADGRALNRLLELSSHAAAGQFRILEASLVPGVADPAPWAQNWALAAARTSIHYEAMANGQSLPLGELRQVRFSLQFWLPAGWKTPRGLTGHPARCAQ
jgi:hypothetical protein